MRVKIELINGKIEVVDSEFIETKEELFGWIVGFSGEVENGTKFLKIEERGKKDRYIMIDKIVKIEEFEEN